MAKAIDTDANSFTIVLMVESDRLKFVWWQMPIPLTYFVKTQMNGSFANLVKFQVHSLVLKFQCYFSSLDISRLINLPDLKFCRS